MARSYDMMCICIKPLLFLGMFEEDVGPKVPLYMSKIPKMDPPEKAPSHAACDCKLLIKGSFTIQFANLQ